VSCLSVRPARCVSRVACSNPTACTVCTAYDPFFCLHAHCLWPRRAPRRPVQSASEMPPAAELQYTSELHRLNDKAIVVAGEATQSAVRELVHLGGQLVHYLAALTLHLTFTPGYHSAVRARLTQVRALVYFCAFHSALCAPAVLAGCFAGCARVVLREFAVDGFRARFAFP
jgi:hypothetical protein